MTKSVVLQKNMPTSDQIDKVGPNFSRKIDKEKWSRGPTLMGTNLAMTSPTAGIHYSQ